MGSSTGPIRSASAARRRRRTSPARRAPRAVDDRRARRRRKQAMSSCESVARRRARIPCAARSSRRPGEHVAPLVDAVRVQAADPLEREEHRRVLAAQQEHGDERIRKEILDDALDAVAQGGDRADRGDRARRDRRRAGARGWSRAADRPWSHRRSPARVTDQDATFARGSKIRSFSSSGKNGHSRVKSKVTPATSASLRPPRRAAGSPSRCGRRC